MPFRCPQCSHLSSLEIVQSIQFPPDSRSDEILLQVVACPGCGFQALAVYEESRRGALDAEAWEHLGFHLEAARLVSIAQAIESCPEPFNPACTCSAHRDLGQQDGGGRWKGIKGMYEGNSFRMEISD